jgi:hypothetical protein
MVFRQSTSSSSSGRVSSRIWMPSQRPSVRRGAGAEFLFRLRQHAYSTARRAPSIAYCNTRGLAWTGHALDQEQAPARKTTAMMWSSPEMPLEALVRSGPSHLWT